MQPSVWVIAGTDTGLRQQHLQGLREQCSGRERLSAERCEPEDAFHPVLLADEAPLLRVVEDYPRWSPAQRRRLAQLVAQPTPGIWVVVLVDRLGEKDPLRSALDQEHLLLATAPRAGGFGDWLMQQASQRDRVLTPGAAGLLVDLIGERTSVLQSELDKLLVCSDGEMDVELVRALVWPEQGERAGWAWCDAVIEGQPALALRELLQLEQAGVVPLALTGLLLARLSAIGWAASGISAEAAQIKPYPWRLAREAVRSGWQGTRLQQALQRAGAADYRLRRSGSLDAWAVMTALSLQLGR